MIAIAAKTVYEWKHFSIKGGDVQRIGEQIDKIVEKRGMVTPEHIVAHWRRYGDKSPFACGFSTDVNKGMKKLWRIEANRLIHCYVEVRERDDQEPERIVPIIGLGTSQTRSRFVSRYTVISDEELTAQVVAECVRQLRGITKRLREIEDDRSDLMSKFIDEQFGKEQPEFNFEAKEAALS